MRVYALTSYYKTSEMIVRPTTPVRRITDWFRGVLGCPRAHAERMAWRVADAMQTGCTGELEELGFELIPLP